MYRCSSCTNFALSKYSNIYNILSTVRRYQSVLFSNITWVWIILRNVQVPCSLLGRPGSRFKRVEIYAIRCRSTVQNLKSLLLFTWNWIIDPARIMYCGYCNCRFSSCVVWVLRFWSKPFKNHNLRENLLKKFSRVHLTRCYFVVLLTLRCGL